MPNTRPAGCLCAVHRLSMCGPPAVYLGRCRLSMSAAPRILDLGDYLMLAPPPPMEGEGDDCIHFLFFHSFLNVSIALMCFVSLVPAGFSYGRGCRISATPDLPMANLHIPFHSRTASLQFQLKPRLSSARLILAGKG